MLWTTLVGDGKGAQVSTAALRVQSYGCWEARLKLQGTEGNREGHCLCRNGAGLQQLSVAPGDRVLVLLILPLLNPRMNLEQARIAHSTPEHRSAYRGAHLHQGSLLLHIPHHPRLGSTSFSKARPHTPAPHYPHPLFHPRPIASSYFQSQDIPPVCISLGYKPRYPLRWRRVGGQLLLH